MGKVMETLRRKKSLLLRSFLYLGKRKELVIIELAKNSFDYVYNAIYKNKYELN
jgi:hypothetical protein